MRSCIVSCGQGHTVSVRIDDLSTQELAQVHKMNKIIQYLMVTNYSPTIAGIAGAVLGLVAFWTINARVALSDGTDRVILVAGLWMFVASMLSWWCADELVLKHQLRDIHQLSQLVEQSKRCRELFIQCKASSPEFREQFEKTILLKDLPSKDLPNNV